MLPIRIITDVTELATAAADGTNLLEDEGYEGVITRKRKA